MFDREIYDREMSQLLELSLQRLREEYPALVLYSVSLWTDPDAAVSAVSIDTAEHSAAEVAEADAWEAAHYARLLAQGAHEEAQLFAPRPGRRNGNPADFWLREVATIEHQAFAPLWAESSGGECWAALGPALTAVQQRALALFAILPLHPDAELAVNSAEDWWDQPVAFRAPAI